MTPHETQRSGPASSAAPPAGLVELEQALPRGVTARRAGKNLVLSWGWSRFSGVFLGIFALFWNLFTWPQILGGELPLLFVVTHGGAGLLVAYWALASLLNRTTVDVSFGHLTVRHGPIPLRRGVDLELDELEQLHVRSRRVKTKNGYRTAHDIVAETRRRGLVMLAPDVDGAEQARVVERAIESHLGIVDRAPRLF